MLCLSFSWCLMELVVPELDEAMDPSPAGTCVERRPPGDSLVPLRKQAGLLLRLPLVPPRWKAGLLLVLLRRKAGLLFVLELAASALVLHLHVAVMSGISRSLRAQQLCVPRGRRSSRALLRR